jgi:superoxide oxidase
MDQTLTPLGAKASMSPSRGYSGTMIALHWGIVLLIIAVYATMELRGLAPRGPERDAVKAVHYMLGLSVLVLVMLRVAVRLSSPPPPAIMPALPAWQAWSARLLHAVLYLFMFAMPVLGWLVLSAQGAGIPFWGLSLPSLVSPDKALARSFKEAHEFIATLGYGLVGLHAAAALFHHYIRRDTTLRRMLPWG